jgi:hypothetical protein
MAKKSIEPYLTPLGTLVINFSTLEYYYKRAVANVSKMDGNHFFIMTSKMYLKNAFELFEDIVKNDYKDKKEILAELKKLIIKTRDVNDRRNDLIHSYWYLELMSIEGLPKLRFKPNEKNNFTGVMTVVKPSEITALNDKIAEVIFDLVFFMKEHIDKDFR